jgi:hypothetical protein
MCTNDFGYSDFGCLFSSYRQNEPLRKVKATLLMTVEMPFPPMRNGRLEMSFGYRMTTDKVDLSFWKKSHQNTIISEYDQSRRRLSFDLVTAQVHVQPARSKNCDRQLMLEGHVRYSC